MPAALRGLMAAAVYSEGGGWRSAVEGARRQHAQGWQKGVSKFAIMIAQCDSRRSPRLMRLHMRETKMLDGSCFQSPFGHTWHRFAWLLHVASGSECGDALYNLWHGGGLGLLAPNRGLNTGVHHFDNALHN